MNAGFEHEGYTPLFQMQYLYDCQCALFLTFFLSSLYPLCVCMLWVNVGRQVCAHTATCSLPVGWEERKIKSKKTCGLRGKKNDLISQGDVEERKVVQSHSPALMHRQVPSQFLSKRWLTSQTPLLYFVAEHSVIWHCMSGFTCER